MTTFTVNVDDQQSEEVVKAFLDAIGIKYEIEKQKGGETERSSFSKKEQELYNRLEDALSDIKKWEIGELELNDARSFINGLSS